MARLDLDATVLCHHLAPHLAQVQGREPCLFPMASALSAHTETSCCKHGPYLARAALCARKGSAEHIPHLGNASHGEQGLLSALLTCRVHAPAWAPANTRSSQQGSSAAGQLEAGLCAQYCRDGTCSKGASCERLHGIYCKVMSPILSSMLIHATAHSAKNFTDGLAQALTSGS